MIDKGVAEKITSGALAQATAQAIQSGIDPGIILASMAATAMSVLCAHGVSRDDLVGLVEIAEKANAAAELKAAIPAGNA